MTVYSTKHQLREIVDYLNAYMRIPYFQDDTVSGKIMEKIISLVHGGEQLATYDYVDVCIRGKVGWQVKATKKDTPLTWKRAKIANSDILIAESRKGEVGLRKLGNAIIDFCNSHARKSFNLYNLDEIGYSRLIIFADNTAVYFERLICTKKEPDIFIGDDYEWHWSAQKNTHEKEQLPALHGVNKKNKKKDFAWHGMGENQLHFSGEKDWWPEIKMPTKFGEMFFSDDGHAIAFKLPSDKVSWESLREFLNRSN